MEDIGIALDFKGDRIFLTDSAYSIYAAKLDGTQRNRCSLYRKMSLEPPKQKFRNYSE